MTVQPPKSSQGQPRRPASLAWLAGLSALGLIGFIVVYGLVLDRTSRPQTELATKPVPGPQGERGPRGEPGPPGPRGDSGVRLVRQNCNTGNCTLECNDDEVLLTAHCGIGRTPAIYPTQHSALCRSPSTARVEIVVACVKISR